MKTMTHLCIIISVGFERFSQPMQEESLPAYRVIYGWKTSTIKKAPKYTPPVHAVAVNPMSPVIVIAADTHGEIPGKLYLMNLYQKKRVQSFATLHDETIMALDYAPNSSLLLCGAYDGSYTIFDTENNKQLLKKPMLGHEKDITSCHFGDNEHSFITGSGDSFVKLWDTTSCTTLQTLNKNLNTALISSVAYRNSLVVWAAHEKNIYLRDIRSKHTTTLQAHDNWVNTVAISPDNQHIATASMDRSVKLWDNRQLEKPVSIDMAEQQVDTVDLHPKLTGKETTILYGVSDGALVLWRPAIEKSQKIVRHNDRITNVKFSPDGYRIASCDQSGAVYITSCKPKSPHSLMVEARENSQHTLHVKQQPEHKEYRSYLSPESTQEDTATLNQEKSWVEKLMDFFG